MKIAQEPIFMLFKKKIRYVPDNTLLIAVNIFMRGTLSDHQNMQLQYGHRSAVFKNLEFNYCDHLKVSNITKETRNYNLTCERPFSYDSRIIKIRVY